MLGAHKKALQLKAKGRKNQGSPNVRQLEPNYPRNAKHL